MYCTFKDRMACLYEDGGRLVRKYLPNKVVLGAQVSGNNVIVQVVGEDEDACAAAIEKFLKENF